MVYKERFVAVIKQGGKILREFDSNTVHLPFGSEYSLFLKNLESRRANVKIHIDGKDALFGKSIILEPNSSLELERFLDDLLEGNKFKFIQKTKEIQEFRGDQIDDGIIRIEFAFECSSWCGSQITYTFPNVVRYVYPSNYDYYCDMGTNSTLTSSGGPSNCFPSQFCSNVNSDSKTLASEQADFSGFANSQPKIEEGITVHGGKSNQEFQNGHIGTLDPSEVIILRLQGILKNKKVKKSVNVKTKIKCPTCNFASKSNNRFCAKCGTCLL